MAAILGGRGLTASTPSELQHALNSAFEDTSQFYLIDVQIPKGVRTPSLDHFAKVLTQKQKMARS